MRVRPGNLRINASVRRAAERLERELIRQKVNAKHRPVIDSDAIRWAMQRPR